MIGLVAHMRVTDGKQSEFEALMKVLQTEVKANETGVLLYDLFKDQKDDTLYVVMEKYVDQTAVDVHGKTEPVAAAMKTIGGCLESRPEIQMLNAVS